MEPLTPQDPLYRLLGQSRPVEPRGDFTQNVLRAVRQLPQRKSVWERVQQWFAALAMPRAVAALVVFSALVLWRPWQPQIVNTTVVASIHESANTLPASDLIKPSDSDVASELDGMNHLSTLLAQQDTSALTDSDIAFLLY